MYDHLNVLSDHFPYIPSEAFLYQPTSKNQDIQNQDTETLTSDDFIIKTKDNQIKRLIFEGNTKFTKFQNTKLKQLDQYLSRKNITIDSRWNRSWKLRWLQSTNYDNKKTIADMEMYVSYLDKNKEITLSQKVQKHLKAGVYYLAGRDSKFRPILILDVKKIITQKITQQELKECEVYFFEFIIRNLLIPGKVEMWNTLIDVGRQGVMSMIGPMKNSISFLQSTFRSRMYVAYIIRPSSTCSWLWSIAQKFLQEDTKRKVVFVDGDVVEGLLQYCHPSQLQTKFGGALKMEQNECWPPKIYDNEYESKVERRILSEEEYRMKYEKGQLKTTKVYEPFVKVPVLVTQQKIYMEMEEQREVNAEFAFSPSKDSERKNQTEKANDTPRKKQTESEKNHINLIEVDKQITICLQKLHVQDITHLQQLNLSSLLLKPSSGFDWLTNS